MGNHEHPCRGCGEDQRRLGVTHEANCLARKLGSVEEALGAARQELESAADWKGRAINERQRRVAAETRFDRYKWTPEAYDVLWERVKQLEDDNQALESRLRTLQKALEDIARGDCFGAYSAKQCADLAYEALTGTTAVDRHEPAEDERCTCEFRTFRECPVHSRAVEKRCPEGDPLCPCPDGDPCHYEAAGGTEAWPAPERRRPCGCVLCVCETEDRCLGCGARLCAEHKAPVPERRRP